MTLLAVAGFDGSAGILATFALGTDGVHPVDRVALSDRPLHLAHECGRLFASLIDDTVAVVAWHEDGALGRRDPITGLDGLPCHVAPIGGELVVSLYRAGQLAVLDADLRATRVALPAGADSRPHHALLAPDGGSVVVCCAGSDELLVYSRGIDGSPQRHPLPPGTGPRNVAFALSDPSRVFVTGETASSILEFDWASGALTPVRTVAASRVVGAVPAAITVGDHAVYQANRTAGTVGVVSLDTDAAVVEVPVGCWPMDIVVIQHDGGEWLAVANRDDGEVTLHPIDDGGVPGLAAHRIPLPGAAAIARS